jgi:hypothetical protein
MIDAGLATLAVAVRTVYNFFDKLVLRLRPEADGQPNDWLIDLPA